MRASRLDRSVVRAIMGHTTEEMTARYAGIGMDSKQDAIARVFPGIVR